MSLSLNLSSGDKQRIKETIQRMGNDERGLYTRSIGFVKLVKANNLPQAFVELIEHDVSVKRLKHVKTVYSKGVEIRIYERKYIQSR